MLISPIADEKTFSILPKDGKDEECDEANRAVLEVETELDRCLDLARKTIK